MQVYLMHQCFVKGENYIPNACLSYRFVVNVLINKKTKMNFKFYWGELAISQNISQFFSNSGELKHKSKFVGKKKTKHLRHCAKYWINGQKRAL